MIKVYNVYSEERKEIRYNRLIFSGGEPHIVFEESDVRGKYLWVDARISTPGEFVELMVLLSAINGCRPKRVGLFLPYFPGARQDRRSPAGSAFTEKVYTDMLSTAQIDYLLIVDPHSDVALALLESSMICPVEAITQTEILSEFIWTIDQYGEGRTSHIISPDAGAEKKAPNIGLPVLCGRKRRDPVDGKILSMSIDVPSDPGKYLVVDDICDGGRTFLMIADHFHNKTNASAVSLIGLYVTHGIFSKGVDDLIGASAFYRIFTTDSFPLSTEVLSDPYVTVYKLWPMAQARMQKEIST